MEVLLLFFIYWLQFWDYEYSMHTLNILSLNVNGLNSAVKRTRVLEYLHRKSISCALIQETHLKQSDMSRFQNKYYKLAAFSCTLNKTKGVLILFNRKLNLTIEHLGSDEKGRFVFIRCKIYNNNNNKVSIGLYLWSEWDRQCIPYTDFQNSTWADWLPSSGGWWF